MSPAIGAAPFVAVWPGGSVCRAAARPPRGPQGVHAGCRYARDEPRRRPRRRPEPPSPSASRPSCRCSWRTTTTPSTSRTVHFYAVSATALAVRGRSPSSWASSGIRRHDRRAAAIGAGFTVMAALLAVHGLTTPGFLIEDEYTAAVGVSGALAVPLGGARHPRHAALAAARARARPRPRLPADRRASSRRSPSARSRCSTPTRSRASRSRCARSSGGSSASTR